MVSSSLDFRARGRFSPECPPSAMSNFLHVPLMENPKISDFRGLNGAGTLDAGTLYFGFGLFRGGIERFSNFGSTGRRNFASAREIPLASMSEMSVPAKIPIQAENPIQNQTGHPVDTPTCSERSLRVLWLFQPTVDRS